MVKTMHEELEAKLQNYQEALKSAYADIFRLKDGVKDSLDNALEQVQLLNIGVALNLDEAHYNAYVDYGKLIPPPPPFADKSSHHLEENQEEKRGEETNLPNPTEPNADAPHC